MAARTAAYYTRLRKVLRHIDTHLADELTAAHLSEVAALSKYHFHRQFSALLGIGVYRYIQLRRMKRAAFQLAFRLEQPITDIALANGYDSPEAFSRAFKRCLGQTPSGFRRLPQWWAWQEAYHPLLASEARHMQHTISQEAVRLIEFPATRLVAMAHQGHPALIGNTVRRFIAWRKRMQLPPHRHATFNLLYRDPAETPAADFRMDIGVAIEVSVEDNGEGLFEIILPAGRCAVLRHIGSDDTLAASVRHLYAAWLPQSGETLRDFPLYCQRVRFFPDVAEHEAVTDIFLPLQ